MNRCGCDTELMPWAGPSFGLSFPRCYAQIRKVAVRSRTRPESNRASCRRQFQIVDNQAWLPGAVNVEPRLGPGQDDFHLGPYSRLEICIGFIESGRFLPGA